MTMKTHKVLAVLQNRIDWLAGKMVQIGDQKAYAYNKLAQEKSATEYAMEFVRREVDFQQRMKVEDRFLSRDESYYDEFIYFCSNDHKAHI